MTIFQNKVALITGSARGLGAAAATLLASRGATVVISDIDQKACEATAATIEKSGGKALAVACDVSNRDSIKKAVETIVAKGGKLDILVNNAGILRDALLLKLEEKDWDSVINVNLKGVFNTTQACAAVMKEKKYGRIVNLASVAWLGNVGQTNYSAAKSGVVGMTKTWAMELARYGITCNAIAPGLIDTDMTKGLPADIKERFIKSIPLQRIGAPNDVAELIAFLTSDAASYITGQVIQIDGGLTTGVRL